VITHAELRALTLFDGITDEAIADVLAEAEEVPFGTGDRLWPEGAPAESWWVLLDGSIDLVRRVGREDTVLGRFDAPGRWAGGFVAWDADGTYLATGRGRDPGRIMRVPAAALKSLLEGVPLAGHIIDGLFHTARAIESGAREREALVALGTLAAGLAHELNNPASAAVRAVDSLSQASSRLLDSLRRLSEAAITADQFSALDALRSELDPLALRRDAMTVADHEDAISDWLDANGVAEGWVLAPPLAAAGADADWCRRMRDALGEAALDPGLGWVASAVQMTTLQSEVKESTQRISNLVSAVKSYSQLDRASVQEIDVREGIDSTLVMLEHRIGDGIVVERQYAEDTPRIHAIAAELNQVWTNLIDNAVDAMDGQGRLVIATRADGDSVLVEVTDSGTGMPPEVQAKAFKPFFTTKDVGKGTGLGLDISRRIVVERHGGDIAVDSVPGRTTMRVRLPISSTAE
jgi:signal transduction histidine kinase